MVHSATVNVYGHDFTISLEAPKSAVEAQAEDMRNFLQGQDERTVAIFKNTTGLTYIPGKGFKKETAFYGIPGVPNEPYFKPFSGKAASYTLRMVDEEEAAGFRMRASDAPLLPATGFNMRAEEPRKTHRRASSWSGKVHVGDSSNRPRSSSFDGVRPRTVKFEAVGPDQGVRERTVRLFATRQRDRVE
ncbi:MAG: hypothetical protein SNF33_03365 [Candidatus Algichlamydia australiensis]|nr:hypothetical protein [Chlamydiales bacterium]